MTTQCHACGATYSDHFARVFGDNQHRIHNCPQCGDTTQSELGLGAAAGLDPTRRIAARGGATQ